MENVLLLNGLEFHEKFFDCVRRNNVDLYKELRNEIADNAFNEDLFQYVRASKNEIDYRYLTDSQLAELSDKEIHKITDIGALRRIPKDRLTFNQLRMVTQSNKVEQINTPVSKIKDILTTLRNCTYVAWQRFRPKNAEFSKSLRAEGIILKDSLTILLLEIS